MPRSTRTVLPPIRPLRTGPAPKRRRRKPFAFGGANRNPVVNGRKFCSRCGCYRLWTDFPAKRRHGTYVVLASCCYACSRIEAAQMRKARQGKLARRARERREYDRIWRDAKRREAGVPVRWPTRPVPAAPDPRLPAQPVRDLLISWLDPVPVDGFNVDMEGIRTVQGDGGFALLGLHTRTNLAALSGLSQRSIWRILSTGQETINLSNADRICAALDVPLSYLYRELA